MASEYKESATTRGSFFTALLWALVLNGIMWVIKGIELYQDVSFASWGLLPRSVSHAYGILTMPFLHGDFNHLVGNSTAFLVLTTLVFWIYPRMATGTLLIVWLLGGFWAWIIGRENYHIGSSGIIYGLAAFIFTAGLLSRNYRMLALSLLIVFLYGGLFWGIFPLQPEQSWEAHLGGAAAGVIAAFFYAGKYPKKKKYEWEDEPETEDDDNAYWKSTPEENTYTIHYIPKPPDHDRENPVDRNP